MGTPQFGGRAGDRVLVREEAALSRMHLLKEETDSCGKVGMGLPSMEDTGKRQGAGLRQWV